MANFGLSFAGLVFFILLNFFNLSHNVTANFKISTISDSVWNRDNYENICLSVNAAPSEDRSIVTENTNLTGSKGKSAETEGRWPGIQITVKSGNEVSNTLVLYHSGMTTGLDPGYDIGLLSANPAFQLYSRFIHDNGIKYMQQAFPIDGCDTLVVPIGFECTAGGEVKFSAVTEPLENYVYLFEDRKEGIFTNIATEDYTVALPSGTANIGRFYLHTKLVSTNVDNPAMGDEGKSGLEIWTSGNRFFIKGLVSSTAVASFYNLQGRIVFEARLTAGNYNSYFIPGIERGIYIIKITDGHKTTSKKIVF
jgi:hypothetical protein